MTLLFALSMADAQSFLPIVIGGGVGCVVLATLAAKYGPKRLLKPSTSLLEGAQETWKPPEGTGADRRTKMRREGSPVPVLLNSAALGSQTVAAFVIDRSTGGLKIASGKPVAAGSTMEVRAENAPDNIPWVTLVVRSCREDGKRFVLGCEFEKQPPWNVLLLFG